MIKPLVSGKELQARYKIKPGREMGQHLEAQLDFLFVHPRATRVEVFAFMRQRMSHYKLC